MPSLDLRKSRPNSFSRYQCESNETSDSLSLHNTSNTVGQSIQSEAFQAQGLEVRLLHLLLELLCDLVDIDVEVLGKELSDVGVLDVAADLLDGGASGAVDVDVDGGVAVGAPADVSAERDHSGEEDEGGLGALGKKIELLLGSVLDAQTRDDELVVDPSSELLLRRGCGQRGEVLDQLGGKVLGGCVGVGEDLGVPVVDGEMARLLQGRGEATGLVIAGGHKDGFGVGRLDEVEDCLECLVVFENLVDLGSRIVDVAGVVDAATLDHEEETLIALGGGLFQGAQSRLCHLAETGVNIIHVTSVQLEGNIGGCKEAEQGQGGLVSALEGVKGSTVTGVGPAVLFLGQLDDVNVIGSAAALGGVGEEEASATAKDEVDAAAEDTLTNLLQGDLVLHDSEQHVAAEAGGGGIDDVCGNGQARHVTGTLSCLEHGATGVVVRQHGDGAVVGLLAAREGGCAGSGVGDEGGGGPGSARAPEVLVQGESIG